MVFVINATSMGPNSPLINPNRAKDLIWKPNFFNVRRIQLQASPSLSNSTTTIGIPSGLHDLCAKMPHNLFAATNSSSNSFYALQPKSNSVCKSSPSNIDCGQQQILNIGTSGHFSSNFSTVQNLAFLIAKQMSQGVGSGIAFWQPLVHPWLWTQSIATLKSLLSVEVLAGQMIPCEMLVVKNGRISKTTRATPSQTSSLVIFQDFAILMTKQMAQSIGYGIAFCQLPVHPRFWMQPNWQIANLISLFQVACSWIDWFIVKIW